MKKRTLGKDFLDGGKIPYIFPIFRIFLFPFGYRITQPFLPVPPCRRRNFFIFQFPPDIIAAMPFYCPLVYLFHNPCCFRIYDQLVFIFW